MTSHAIYDGHYLKVHISIYALEVKMMEKDSRLGLNRLAEVPDKRNPRGKRLKSTHVLTVYITTNTIID